MGQSDESVDLLSRCAAAATAAAARARDPVRLGEGTDVPLLHLGGRSVPGWRGAIGARRGRCGG